MTLLFSSQLETKIPMRLAKKKKNACETSNYISQAEYISLNLKGGRGLGYTFVHC